MRRLGNDSGVTTPRHLSIESENLWPLLPYERRLVDAIVAAERVLDD